MDENARIAKWDNARALLILLVVTGHIADGIMETSSVEISNLMKSIYIFIYMFHMPVFLFLAGLFHKPYTRKAPLRVRKILSYILLGFALKFVNLFFANLLHRPASDRAFFWLSDSHTPWFLFSLAIMMVLVYLLRNRSLLCILPLSILIACLSGYNNSIQDFLYLSRTIVFFPFYYIGYCLEESQVRRFIKNKAFLFLSLLTLAAFAYLCFVQTADIYAYRGFFTGRNPYAKTPFPDCGFSQRIISYAISFIMGFAFLCVIPQRKIKLLSYVGTKTLGIYFWHIPCIWILRYFKVADYIPSFLPDSVYLLTAIPITLLLSCPVFSLPLKWIESLTRSKKKESTT